MLLPRWADFIGKTDDLEFAGKYLEHARDMFYARLTPDTLNETDLRSLFTEVQMLVQAMVEKSKRNA